MIHFLSLSSSKHVLLFKYSKVRSPLLSYSLYLAIYFLYTIGTSLFFISKVVKLKTCYILSNLSACSSHSPPIYLKNYSTFNSLGIIKLSPGAGVIGLIVFILNFGVLNLWPFSVLPMYLYD